MVKALGQSSMSPNLTSRAYFIAKVQSISSNLAKSCGVMLQKTYQKMVIIVAFIFEISHRALKVKKHPF
jgi:hypothetical protein